MNVITYNCFTQAVHVENNGPEKKKPKTEDKVSKAADIWLDWFVSACAYRCPNIQSRRLYRHDKK